MTTDAVTIRIATDADRAEIARVAGRDTNPVPEAPRLVAERNGRIEAVLSLRTGAIVADPFHPTAALVEMLRCQAANVRAALPRADAAVRHRRHRGVAGRIVPRLAGGRA